MHLPTAPTDDEKYRYIHHRQYILTFFSLFSFSGVVYSCIRFFSDDPILVLLYPYLVLVVYYYFVSLLINAVSRPFSMKKHRTILLAARDYQPTVDIFLPVCGEPLEVLHNTWRYVRELQEAYGERCKVYALDDSGSPAVEQLARDFGFTYFSRPNKGEFKKSGNLRYAYERTDGEYMVIFDADFCPRSDFLHETLPYMLDDPKRGIVQTPQYFDVVKSQIWLERGAGAVQELFYRSVQQSRNQYGGAICVGTNAVYRRAAFDSIGGPVQIEHSEDVHTGFAMKRKGWSVSYVPIILAKGVCPSELPQFFNQQYRWAAGSMSLLGSKTFWKSDFKTMTLFCFLSGFLYYIVTAINVIMVPLMPLALIYIVPWAASIFNYTVLLPSFLYTLVIVPLWHRCAYGPETLAIKTIYGWAHGFAIIDSIRGKPMEWKPTGKKRAGSMRYQTFWTLFTVYATVTSVLWAGGSLLYMLQDSRKLVDFAPVFVSGMIYAVMNVYIIDAMSEWRLFKRFKYALTHGFGVRQKPKKVIQ